MSGKIEDTPGGALAVFSAFVCGSILCAVNIGAVYNVLEFISPWQSLVFLLLSLSAGFLSFGSWIITLNALLFGVWSCCFAYGLFNADLPAPLYFKLVLPILPAIFGSFVISDLGFYSADMLTEAYRSFPKPIKQKGLTALAVFAAAVIIYVVFIILLREGS